MEDSKLLDNTTQYWYELDRTYNLLSWEIPSCTGCIKLDEIRGAKVILKQQDLYNSGNNITLQIITDKYNIVNVLHFSGLRSLSKKEAKVGFIYAIHSEICNYLKNK